MPSHDNLEILSAVTRHTLAEKLTLMQLAALVETDAKGGSIGEIGKRLNIAPPGATRLIDVLVTRGLIQRHDDRNDARVALVRVTAKGRSTLRRIANATCKVGRQ